MFDNILLPLDGSHSCLRARQVAARLSMKFGSKITAIHVISHDFMHPELKASYNLPPLILEELDKTYQKTGQKILDAAEDYFREAGIRIETVLMKADNPAEIVLEKAKQQNFDLIIIGNISESKSSRYSLGSIAEKVSLHAPCSVIIAKKKTEFKKLLIAYDSSEDAKKALKVGVELCKHFSHTKMTVLNVENGELHRLEPDIAKDIGEKILDEATTFVEGVVCDRRLEYGNPAEMILRISKIDNYDLILLGGRGMGGIRSFFTGSVGTDVSINAQRSVFVVR